MGYFVVKVANSKGHNFLSDKKTKRFVEKINFGFVRTFSQKNGYQNINFLEKKTTEPFQNEKTYIWVKMEPLINPPFLGKTYLIKQNMESTI